MQHVVTDIDTDDLNLCETLRTAMFTANALDGYHARENGGSYGAIKTALITTLACAIVSSSEVAINFDYCRLVARRVYNEIIDNGESVEYNLDLWNRKVIGFGF